MLTPEQLTKRYEELGLPETLPGDMKLAWEDYEAGRGAPVRLLPKNGGTCDAETMGSPTCGFPTLIDGSCVNSSNHRDVVEAELDEEGE